jgi:hypothetical protein
MDVRLLCLYVVLSCVVRGLCDGLITRPEESYRVSNCMCDHRNPERGPMFQVGNDRKMNEIKKTSLANDIQSLLKLLILLRFILAAVGHLAEGLILY